MYVQGSIQQSQGEYIIAINANQNSTTNVNPPPENPGEPTAQEAQSGTYAHWDQEFIYGFDTTAQPFGFAYRYKVLTNSGGTTTPSFVPIIIGANDFTFNPSGSVNGGTGNVLSITLPIADLSIRGNPNGSNPPTVSTPPATLLYVNYITTDTSHVPQDQLGCCGVASSGYQLIVDLTTMATYQSQLTTPPGKTGPSNANLFITGGQVIVSP